MIRRKLARGSALFCWEFVNVRTLRLCSSPFYNPLLSTSHHNTHGSNLVHALNWASSIVLTWNRYAMCHGSLSLPSPSPPPKTHVRIFISSYTRALGGKNRLLRLIKHSNQSRKDYSCFWDALNKADSMISTRLRAFQYLTHAHNMFYAGHVPRMRIKDATHAPQKNNG